MNVTKIALSNCLIQFNKHINIELFNSFVIIKLNTQTQKNSFGKQNK